MPLLRSISFDENKKNVDENGNGPKKSVGEFVSVGGVAQSDE